MVFVWPVAEFESRIACRSEPEPLSPIEVTSNVESSVRFSIASSHGRLWNSAPENLKEEPGRRRRREETRGGGMKFLIVGRNRHVGQAFQPDGISVSG